MPIFQGLSLGLQPSHHSSCHYNTLTTPCWHLVSFSQIHVCSNSLRACSIPGTGLCQLLPNSHNPVMMKRQSSALILSKTMLQQPPQHQQPHPTTNLPPGTQRWQPSPSLLSSLGFLVSKLFKLPRWFLFSNLRKRQAARPSLTLGNNPPFATVQSSHQSSQPHWSWICQARQSTLASWCKIRKEIN